ncbi:Peptide chain release factor N(5)-glutamine methyltransferase [hydrothermal vent metagenome]|uniref:peptide chain release factor N(5)-glutamine methyltransferase n=1 Tax=hydrothermal vent metagenome TaxID=652676 RepID=A0A3B1CJ64_9ZZZZ
MTETVLDLIGRGEKILQENGIETARLDSELLLAHVFQKERSYILAHFKDNISAITAARFDDILARRKNREPLAYITCNKEFYSLNFKVSPDVLIPRPETETIVDTALKLYDDETKMKVLDIGVGSGIIAITLAIHRPGWRLLATDSSEEALKVAGENVKAHNVEERIDLGYSDHFSGVCGRYHLIVSNPPYIPLGAGYVSPEAKLFEPHEALYAREDGLGSIREIIVRGGEYLMPGGRIIMEIGDRQTADVEKLIAEDGKGLKLEKIVKDLQGLDRVVVMTGIQDG